MLHGQARGNPWINLKSDLDLATAYSGAVGLRQVLEDGLAVPLALASADFDEYGVPDLVSGYVGPSGGILILHRGNLYSIYPNSPRLGVRDSGFGVGERSTNDHRLMTNDAFLVPARVFELPEAPDFLGTGDFDADGHWDVVAAPRGSNALYMLPGNGQGDFGRARRIELPGKVTVLVTGEINRADGLTDVVVGIVGSDGSQVLVFESPRGALTAQPEAFALPAEATALAVGQLDDRFEMNLAIAAGDEVVIVHGRDRRLSLDEIRQADVAEAIIESRSFPFSITSLALGDFVWDQTHQTDIALLADDGTLHILTNPDRSEEDAGVHGGPPVHSERGSLPARASVSGRPRWAANQSFRADAKPLSEWRSEVLVTGSCPLGTQLSRAKISSFPTDDLVVIDRANHQLHILTANNGPETAGKQRLTTLFAKGMPVAVLLMRLNVDALSDLVILTSGPSGLTVALTAAAATFTVNSTGDGEDNNTADGVCDDGTGKCTLRAAIQQANALAGLDTIQFNIPGTGVPTITPGSALPTITGVLTIDGTTQPGGRVELSGASAGDVDGLTISAGSSTVRGLVINRFGNAIRLTTNGGNVIERNYIGTDTTGMVALGNSEQGVSVSNAPRNTIGGTRPEARNVISGNAFGVVIRGSGATGNQVQGNFIGTDVNGASPLPNASHGVSITSSASNNTIGGRTRSAGNTIAFNGADGVFVHYSATGNAIRRNSTFSNTELGIDLGGDGVTPNDPGDGDTGANNQQNFPVLSSASPSGDGMIIAGRLNSTPNATFDLDFFSNKACDPSGFGEGESYVGSATVTTNSSGDASFVITLPITVPTGEFTTATATDANKNTSVFSQCIKVTAAPCTFSISPTSQSFPAGGGTGSVTVTADAGCAWTAVSNVSWITITSRSSGSGNGTVNYTVAANTGPARTGTMTIAGQTFTVTQEAGCTFSINPTSQSFPASGGTGSVSVTAGAECTWTAVSNVNWITITSGSSGSGSGTVNYSVTANSGPARTGTMTIAGQTFTVTQEPVGVPAKTWAKSYGGGFTEKASSIQQTSDGGYILAGTTTSSAAGNDDVWVFKLDSSGNVEWQRAYGSINQEAANCIRQTSDRGYILVGTTSTGVRAPADVWVLKVDAGGNIQWQKAYGGETDDAATSVQQTPDGGYNLAGSTRSFGGGNADIWILRLDSSGNVQWQKTYGGGADDFANSVWRSSDGGYIVAGSTNSFGAGSADVWVLKLDSEGEVQWQKVYGGASSDVATSIRQTSDGGYIVGGSTSSFGAGSVDAWVLKLDSSGNVEGQKTYGGAGADVATSLQQALDRRYIVAGRTYSFGAGKADVWVLNLDSSGNVEWQKTYGGANEDAATSIEQASDSGYIVTGFARALDANGRFRDFCGLKLDSSGNIGGCTSSGMGVNSNGVAGNTSVRPVGTSASTSASTATVSNTSVRVTNTTASPVTQCTGTRSPTA